VRIGAIVIFFLLPLRGTCWEPATSGARGAGSRFPEVTLSLDPTEVVQTELGQRALRQNNLKSEA
jgi:hypothetical protein